MNELMGPIQPQKELLREIIFLEEEEEEGGITGNNPSALLCGRKVSYHRRKILTAASLFTEARP
jgi:hypothetical protein